jgi:maltose alpha-D-glucosyltransferase/alpha-amylase
MFQLEQLITGVPTGWHRFDEITCGLQRKDLIYIAARPSMGKTTFVAEGDIVILDFEGEPARSLTERRARSSPMRDVAGMIRSFGYAALTGLEVATKARPEDAERLAPWAQLWETWVSAAFMRAYLPPVASAGILPTDWSELETVLHVFVVDKALYELGYELNSRPEWVHVPLTGLLQLIQGATPGGIAAPDAGSHV